MFSKSLKAARRGFTLIEIMIVVLIIGILLAIAVPNFVKARESSRTKSCLANMRQIEAAKDQYAMDNKKSTGDTATMAQLSGPNGYIKSEPTCPSGPNTSKYAPGAIGTNVQCPNVPALHALPL